MSENNPNIDSNSCESSNASTNDEMIKYFSGKLASIMGYAVASSKVKGERGRISHEIFESGIRKTIQWS